MNQTIVAIKNGGLEMRDALALIRSKAVYFVCGKWPDIVQNDLPSGTFSPDKKYAIAILPVEE